MESRMSSAVAKYRMRRVSRAYEKSETQGFIKICVDAETKQILGAALQAQYRCFLLFCGTQYHQSIPRYRQYHGPIVCPADFWCHGFWAARFIRNAAQQELRRRIMKILMVLTSHDTLGNTGRKTGFWLEEFAAPYFVFRDAGIELTLASPKGGQPP